MTFKLIHVGLGGWGMDWETTALQTIQDQVERVAIVEAYEPVLESAKTALKLRDDQCFTSLEDALEAVESDAVLITAPMEAHVPLAIAAMKAGRHVLTEKPMAPTVDEARDAIRVAEETGKVLQVSQNYRFYPAARQAAAMVRDKALGELGTINIDFRQWDNDAEAGTHRHYRFVHPLVFDMSIHHFDLMRMIIGSEPTKIYVQQTDPKWSKYIEEASATIVVTFPDDIIVSYRGSWVSSDERTDWTGDWRMECADGLIRWTGRAGGDAGTDGDKVTIRTRDGKVTPVPLDPMPVWGRSAGVLAFIEAIRSGTEPETSARRNLGSVALMEAAAKSLAAGEAIEIEEVG
ncbi:MAG TPA: Gfo/Idh/MocA family oxidoreductase [Thermomicrobiales bacterium]|nr:Gfo/Idh/MocA family oxidoreductase [Thermomicrobiales bacterium]